MYLVCVILRQANPSKQNLLDLILQGVRVEVDPASEAAAREHGAQGHAPDATNGGDAGRSN